MISKFRKLVRSIEFEDPSQKLTPKQPMCCTDPVIWCNLANASGRRIFQVPSFCVPVTRDLVIDWKTKMRPSWDPRLKPQWPPSDEQVYWPCKGWTWARIPRSMPHECDAWVGERDGEITWRKRVGFWLWSSWRRRGCVGRRVGD